MKLKTLSLINTADDIPCGYLIQTDSCSFTVLSLITCYQTCQENINFIQKAYKISIFIILIIEFWICAHLQESTPELLRDFIIIIFFTHFNFHCDF